MAKTKESITVKDLRSLAKQRGLKGYSRLKKAELLQLLTPTINIMNEPVPNIGRAPLVPQIVKRGVKSLKDITSKAAEKAKEKIDALAKWITNYIPKPKAIDPVFKSFIEKIMTLYSNTKTRPTLKVQAAQG